MEEEDPQQGGGVELDDSSSLDASTFRALSQGIKIGLSIEVVPWGKVTKASLDELAFRFRLPGSAGKTEPEDADVEEAEDSIDQDQGLSNSRTVATSTCGKWAQRSTSDPLFDPLQVDSLVDGDNSDGEEPDYDNDKGPGGDQTARSKDSARVVLKTRTWCTNFDIQADAKWARSVSAVGALPITMFNAESGAWTGAFPVDISNLLDGDTECEACFGPAPGREADYFAPPPFGKKLFKSVRIRVVTSKPALTDALAEKLNPFSLSLLTARPLPGLIIEEDNPAMRPYILDPITKERDVFALQKRHCLPVYATIDLFKGLLSERRNNALRTVPFQQGPSKVKLGLKTTILCGELNRDRMAERLESEPVVIHLHDRDVPLITTEKALQKHHARFEQLYRDSQGTCESSESAASARSKSEDNSDFAGAPSSSIVSSECFSVDQLDLLAWEEYLSILREDSEQQTRGKSVVPLGELWNSSRELVDRQARDLHGTFAKKGSGFSSRRKAADIKVRAPVTPVKRQICVGGEVERAELDLTSTELLVRQPGRFFEATTEIRVAASLTHPLHHHRLSLAAIGARNGTASEGTLAPADGQESEILNGQAEKALDRRNPVFERVVFMFLYSRSDIMLKLRAAMQEINEAVLPNAESMRSYQLTDEEVKQANDGQLDILTGFQVVDDEFRIVVLEGIGEKGIKRLFQRLPKVKNNEQCRILSNSTVRYTNRIYTPFEVDLKAIRLRDPLRSIMQTPEIYDTFKVDTDCQQALVFLANIRSTLRSRALARVQGFPTIEMLSRLESKYGESVSLEDLDGVPKQAKKGPRVNSRQSNNNEKDECDDNLAIQDKERTGTLRAKSKSTGQLKPSSRRNKAPTDDKNPNYLAHLREWKPADHRAEHRQARRQVQASLKNRLRARAEADNELREKFGGKNGECYLYAGQKLNFVERQQDELRRVLSKHTGVTYTYSEQFQSLGFCMVNEEQVARDEAAAARERFMTKKGFKYPVARTAVEDRTPKNPVSDARAEELATEWIDKNSLAERRRAKGGSKLGLKDFDCIPTNDYLLFGGYHADGTRNPAFFTSVHAGGDGVELAAKEKLKREKEEWHAKVIVDNISFRPHQGIKSPKPCQLDKLRDILQTKPEKRGIRIVRNAKLPSGKPVPLRPPPVSIHLGNQ